MRGRPLPVVPYQPTFQRGINRNVIPIGRTGFRGFAGTTATAAGGAASGAAAGASIGSVVPGIGTAIGAAAGAIVGAITGLVGGKSNPQIQIDKTNAINLFSQYQAIAGTVSGRSIGYENMDMIFRGACFMGHFPGWNNETELPDSLMSMPGSPYGQNDNCFAVLWAAAQKGVPAPGSSGKYTGNGGAPVTNAKTFVDNYVWPSNSSNVDTDPWATNTDAIGKQVIYDAADAYIATQSSNTTPYIANPAVQKPAVSSTPVATTVAAPVTQQPVTATPAPASYSPAGSYLVTGQSGGSIVAPSGTWTMLSNGAFALNGSQQTTAPTVGGHGTVGILYMNSQLYAYNSDGTAAVWDAGAFYQTAAVPTPPAAITQAIQHYSAAATAPASPTTSSTNPTAPPVPTVLESSDGSEVTAPGTALEAGSGQILFFGPQATGDPSNQYGYPIWSLSPGSTTPTRVGYSVGMILGNGGILYAVNGIGGWAQWQSPQFVTLAAAPNLNGPTTTTSTTSASPQSGVSCTPGKTATTSGSIVTTTASGDAVTDDDIQDLISQMSGQNATAQQTYSAVLAALQAQGANVSAGVQSQVASQVSSSVPTTAPASTGSSDLGIYIVGGGIALLGLLYFMGHRRA